MDTVRRPCKRWSAANPLSAIIPPSGRSDCDMPLPRFLSLPRKDRRARSETRSEADVTQDPSEASLAVPRPTESDPDLGTSSSTLKTLSPPALQNRASSGTRTAVSWAIHLTVPPYNPDSAVSDLTQSVAGKARRPKPWDRIFNRDTTTSETKSKSSLASDVYASAKMVIDVVKESSDVFPPLKAVVGGLSAILNHCDVCFASPFTSTMLMVTPASDGQSTDNTIPDTSGRTACEITSRASSGGR